MCLHLTIPFKSGRIGDAKSEGDSEMGVDENPTLDNKRYPRVGGVWGEVCLPEIGDDWK